MRTGLRMLARRWIAKAEIQMLKRLPPPALHAAQLGAVPSALLVSVYRKRNAGIIGTLAQEAEALGARVVLWGLNGVSPELERRTVGT